MLGAPNGLQPHHTQHVCDSGLLGPEDCQACRLEARQRLIEANARKVQAKYGGGVGEEGAAATASPTASNSLSLRLGFGGGGKLLLPLPPVMTGQPETESDEALSEGGGVRRSLSSTSSASTSTPNVHNPHYGGGGVGGVTVFSPNTSDAPHPFMQYTSVSPSSATRMMLTGRDRDTSDPSSSAGEGDGEPPCFSDDGRSRSEEDEVEATRDSDEPNTMIAGSSSLGSPTTTTQHQQQQHQPQQQRVLRIRRSNQQQPHREEKKEQEEQPDEKEGVIDTPQHGSALNYQSSTNLPALAGSKNSKINSSPFYANGVGVGVSSEHEEAVRILASSSSSLAMGLVGLVDGIGSRGGGGVHSPTFVRPAPLFSSFHSNSGEKGQGGGGEESDTPRELGCRAGRSGNGGEGGASKMEGMGHSRGIPLSPTSSSVGGGSRNPSVTIGPSSPPGRTTSLSSGSAPFSSSSQPSSDDASQSRGDGEGVGVRGGEQHRRGPDASEDNATSVIFSAAASAQVPPAPPPPPTAVCWWPEPPLVTDFRRHSKFLATCYSVCSYAVSTRRVCGVIAFSTAMYFIQRFVYCHGSEASGRWGAVARIDPATLSAAAVFLATKTENFKVKLSSIIEVVFECPVNDTERHNLYKLMTLQVEVMLLATLSGSLTIIHPFGSLSAIAPETSLVGQQANKLYSYTVMTPLALYFDHQQIAMALVSIVVEEQKTKGLLLSEDRRDAEQGKVNEGGGGAALPTAAIYEAKLGKLLPEAKVATELALIECFAVRGKGCGFLSSIDSIVEQRVQLTKKKKTSRRSSLGTVPGANGGGGVGGTPTPSSVTIGEAVPYRPATTPPATPQVASPRYFGGGV